MAFDSFSAFISPIIEQNKQKQQQEQDFQSMLASIVARNPQIAPYVSGAKNWDDFVEKLKNYDPIAYQVKEQTALNAIPQPVQPVTPQQIGQNFFDTWKEGAFNTNPTTANMQPDQLSMLKQQFPGLFQQTDVLQGTSPATEMLPQNPFVQKIATGIGLNKIQIPTFQQQDTIVPNPTAQASIASKQAYSDLNTINAKLKPFGVALQATDRGYEPTVIPGAETMPSGQSPAFEMKQAESEAKVNKTESDIQKNQAQIDYINKRANFLTNAEDGNGSLSPILGRLVQLAKPKYNRDYEQWQRQNGKFLQGKWYPNKNIDYKTAPDPDKYVQDWADKLGVNLGGNQQQAKDLDAISQKIQTNFKSDKFQKLSPEQKKASIEKAKQDLATQGYTPEEINAIIPAL